jgi:hypothetical protein
MRTGQSSVRAGSSPASPQMGTELTGPNVLGGSRVPPMPGAGIEPAWELLPGDFKDCGFGFAGRHT